MFKFAFLISIPLLTTQLLADAKNGKELFNEQDCLKCHGVERFKSRKDKVNSYDILYSRVDRCQNNTNTGWFEEEVEDVSQYLNKSYYHFKANETNKDY